MEMRVVAAAFIENDGKILILKRQTNDETWPGLWEIPGGKANIENGESVEDALIREVKEETNLNIIPANPANVFEYDVEENGKKIHTVEIDFIANASDCSKFRISDEHTDFTWISEDKVKNYEMSEEMKRSVLTYFCFKRMNSEKPSYGEKLRMETEKWLAKIKIERPNVALIDMTKTDFLQNVDAYISDSEHFLKKSDFVRSFEAVIWAWANLEIGERLGLLNKSPK